MNETDITMLGKVIYQYQIKAKINDGAFGTVFLGEHTSLNNLTVAVKILHTIFLHSQEQRDAFLQEANHLAMLQHPHILKVLDSGLYEGRPYIISDYAGGGTLRERIIKANGQPMRTDEAIRVLAQVGAGLQYAQNKGLIHRDLKPENILFNTNNDALLADFNISVVSTATSSVKNVDSIGTPPYMAPEQFKGQVCKESDQYALGVIAYELFTGRRPFHETDSTALYIAHASQIPTPLRQINPYLPEHVERAVLKALAKRREDRFSSIDDFVAALTLAAPGYTGENQPIGVLPESPEAITTAFLSYPLFLASGLAVLFFKENQRRFVHFHAWQSILFSGVVMALLLLCWLFTHNTSPQGTLTAYDVAVGAYAIIGFVALVGWLALLYNAWKGLYFKVPLLGELADRLATSKLVYNEQEINTVPGTQTLAIISENDKYVAMMSYAFFWVTGLITFFVGQKNRYIRFHSLQSILFFCMLMLAFLVSTVFLEIWPPLGFILYAILLSFLIAGWALGIYHAFKGHYYKLPFVGNLAKTFIEQDASLL